MEKQIVELINLIAIATVIAIPFLNTKWRAIFTVGAISVEVIFSFLLSFLIFSRGSAEFAYNGSIITGEIPIRIDYLSAWFIAIISFTFLTGAWYGLNYMKKYREQSTNIALHCVAYVLAFTSLIDICIIQNGFVLLVVWEVMALSSFIIIIFEHYKAQTLKAGINFLIQSHICILFLTLAFMWVKVRTGSFDFRAIAEYTANEPATLGIGLFIFFFFGFAIKAGFVPFHTWLPQAHPAAPAHISGVMSGVIIKIGIYGILRILLLTKANMATIGYFMLVVSSITGIYGVMLAIVQHNLKKLLAYHSIENIGIIGIGIGLGCLGLGYENQMLTFAGFGGALLHTLNHSLFKSLLFFGAGNVYMLRGTMNIEALGGVIKHIPKTAFLFLIASLAICGLPPFNGFVSEFLIYGGLFNGLHSSHFWFILFMLMAILSLVLIGGLALICFTKAFGIVFLGTSRTPEPDVVKQEKNSWLFPLFSIATLIIIIGLFPSILAPTLLKIVGLYSYIDSLAELQIASWIGTMSTVGKGALLLVGLSLLVYSVRYWLTRNKPKSVYHTWGCGFVGNGSKMQYTASSFVRSYRKLAEPVLLVSKEKQIAKNLFPTPVAQHTHAYDKIESILIDKPIFWIRSLLNRFVFLQNGKIQAYMLYGLIFISAVVIVPLLVSYIVKLFNFLNQL